MLAPPFSCLSLSISSFLYGAQTFEIGDNPAVCS